MKKTLIIGAGQLGSRHLQALKLVNRPLDISVIDPSEGSLRIAMERYDSIKSKYDHKIEYINKIKKFDQTIDLAIVATNSDIRAEVIRELLKFNKVKYLILEKLLFTKKRDYTEIAKLLIKNKIKTWVNCPRRTMPFYKNLKKYFDNKKIQFYVNRGQVGQITDMIHFIDYIAYLTNCYDFKVDTSLLDKKIIPSKRKGFLEINGSVIFNFKNGSVGNFACYTDGDAPIQINIFDGETHYIIRQNEDKAWMSDLKNNWKYTEVEAPIIYQSQLTKDLAENLFNEGNCLLPTYKESVKLHIPLLDSLKNFINKNSKNKFNYYPFT